MSTSNLGNNLIELLSMINPSVSTIMSEMRQNSHDFIKIRQLMADYCRELGKTLKDAKDDSAIKCIIHEYIIEYITTFSDYASDKILTLELENSCDSNSDYIFLLRDKIRSNINDFIMEFAKQTMSISQKTESDYKFSN